jgi:hypothetical protein
MGKTRSLFDGFNPPASEADLTELRRVVGPVPDDVLLLYQDHDGSKRLPRRGGTALTARLMPVAEMLKNQSLMDRVPIPKAGTVVWLWTDDNSNYCGIYADGPLQGFLTVLDHEEQMLTPAFRSVVCFMEQLLVQAIDGENPAYDISQLEREIPELISDTDRFDEDSRLASTIKRRYLEETNLDLRRLYAFCTICLTPFACTGEVLSFLDDADGYTAEAAILLLEVRRHTEAIERLEMLARETGTQRGQAARVYLVRMGTDESRAAIGRLRNVLDERGRELLERLVHSPRPLPPPRW